MPALVLVLCGVGTGHATTISVGTAVDDTTVNGSCTLREAVIAANTDAAVDACPAGSGADVITVPAGTYLLTLVGAGEDAAATGDLDVTADVEIQGAGAASTIVDGNLMMVPGETLGSRSCSSRTATRTVPARATN